MIDFENELSYEDDSQEETEDLSIERPVPRQWTRREVLELFGDTGKLALLKGVLPQTGPNQFNIEGFIDNDDDDGKGLFYKGSFRLENGQIVKPEEGNSQLNNNLDTEFSQSNESVETNVTQVEKSGYAYTEPGKLKLTATDILSYLIAYNHMGMNAYRIFDSNEYNPHVIEGNLVNAIRNASTIDELTAIRGLIYSRTKFDQIAPRLGNRTLSVLKAMVNGGKFPIIAPDTVYLDEALGGWRDPRDYIGRTVSIVPVGANYQFTALIFDVKNPAHRSGNGHFGDGNPELLSKLGIQTNYPYRPYYLRNGVALTWDQVTAIKIGINPAVLG